jgi:septation ring formation regulator EzrA
MSLSNSFVRFQEEFIKSWNRYVDLHKELDAYRGQAINNTNIDAINKVISDLQDTFTELYTSINFVKERYVLCSEALLEYTKFMDEIKSAGALPVDSKSKIAES